MGSPFVFLLMLPGIVFAEQQRDDGTYKYYQLGVQLGIINPEKYAFSSFQKDEQNVFKDLYSVYISQNDSARINYEEWLVTNNFGIFSDSQDAILLQRKISKRSTAGNKKAFVRTVKQGDILISSGEGSFGIIGHAAIMTTDYWVLEMPGLKKNLNDNNRRIPKHKWFDEHASGWTTVYRCPDKSIARKAAKWASTHYYNPSGGARKTIHIMYALTADVSSINPSYCSKLVIQSYYFGTGSAKVITDLSVAGKVIFPATIPLYFLSPFKLVNKGRY